jgi:hypothetical protein
LLCISGQKIQFMVQMSGYSELTVIRISKQGAAFIAVKLGKE